MSVHYLQTTRTETSVHADADAVRMMILQHSDEAIDALAEPRRFGCAKVVVTAGFPNRQVLTMGRATYRN